MQKFSRKLSFIVALVSLISMSKAFAQETITKAVAVIYPTKGNESSGKVTFTVVNDGVRVVADIDGLKPGEHGFHIHEYGDCSSLDAASAGGHFNPTNTKHGCPESPEHHVGDMGNIAADEKGHAHYDQVNKDIKFEGNSNIIGRSVIIHSGRDDCVSQPTGDSGARVGCGVIGISKS